MQRLGEGFGQAVGERLDHDLGIIVIGALEPPRHILLADAGGHGEAAEIIREPRLFRRDEVGQREIGTGAAVARHLLTQRVQRGEPLLARIVGIKLDVVADAVGGPEADHGVGGQPFLGDQLLQHGLRVVEERPRGLAIFVVLEDAGIGALQLPGMEERRPVDIAGELGEIVALEAACAEKARFGRCVVLPVELQPVDARIGERGAQFLSLTARIGLRPWSDIPRAPWRLPSAAPPATSVPTPRPRRGTRRSHRSPGCAGSWG